MTVRVNRHIDWLSLTFPAELTPSMIWPHDEFVEIGKGLHGYRKMSQSEHFGVVAEWDGAENMGVHMVFSGDCLAAIREQLLRGHLPVFACASNGQGRASRIDMTINIVGGSLTPTRAHKALQTGKLITKARAWRFVQGNTDGVAGDTLYLGSRDSERFVRIYDKAAERGIVNGEAHLRLELELKGMLARAGLETCMLYGVDAAIVGAFEQCFRWDTPEIDLAFSGPSQALPEFPRKVGNTEKWLLSQCIPALAKLIRLKPEFHAKFVDALSAEMRRLDDLANGVTRDEG